MDSVYPDVILRPGGGRCRVLYSYTPQNEDELELEVDDEIEFLSEVEEGWWRGKLRNKVGVFPSNFVEAKDDDTATSEGEISSPDSAAIVIVDDAPVLPPKPVKETCKVLFAYDAANDDELTLRKDDIITIITKEVEDKGWWKGELKGKVGLFPDNFVEMVSSVEEVGSPAQQKKPDRPSKPHDSKIPLISSSTPNKSQDNLNQKDQDDKIAGLKNEGPFDRKTDSKIKSDSPGSKIEKTLDLFPIKPDTVATQRRSLEMKANENQNQSPPIVGKKPVLPPPPSNKPKPTVAKPNPLFKRFSKEGSELADVPDGGGSSKMSNSQKRLSGDTLDLNDLDSIERNEMLSNPLRPRAPGRRPPTKSGKENEPHGPLTNGNLDNSDKEKSQRGREWEKNKPPWVDELKSNLIKSTKPSPTDAKSDRKSPLGPQRTSVTSEALSSSPNHTSLSSTSIDVSKSGNNITVKQHSLITGSQKSFGSTEANIISKVTEISSFFAAGADKTKPVAPSSSPPKSAADSFKKVNSLSDQSNSEFLQISKKDFQDLKSRVEKLEKLVIELATQLRDEAEKRRLVEKELNKLADLVTSV